MMRTSLRIDVEEWTKELTEVWKPTRILEVRNEGTRGVLFIALVPPGLTLHLRIQWDGVDGCTIWQGTRYLLWDRAMGFCHSSPAPDDPKEQGEWHIWHMQMRAFIRRNCFLMGCDVGAPDEERRQRYRSTAP